MGHSQENLVILLVEDNAGDVYLFREALEEAGFPHTLHVVCHGNEVIDFLHAQAGGGKAWPDLMILDLNLPGKTGREIMAEMQEEPALKGLPVAVLSTSRSECHIGSDFPQLRSTFAAKTPDFGELVMIVRRFKDFALGQDQMGAAPQA